ncbi:MAG: hypothetical protein K9L64_00535, partial [Candidatus Izimaplasma sp.]|nr:hypothetical protein [Candidatus Izimaplasma bacterium]
MKLIKEKFIKYFQNEPDEYLFKPLNIKLFGDLTYFSLSFTTNIGIKAAYRIDDDIMIKVILDDELYILNKNKQNFNNKIIMDLQKIYQFFIYKYENNKKGMNILIDTNFNDYPSTHLKYMFIELMSKMFSEKLYNKDYLIIIEGLFKEDYNLHYNEYTLMFNNKVNTLIYSDKEKHEFIDYQLNDFLFMFLPIEDKISRKETQIQMFYLVEKLNTAFPDKNYSNLSFDDYIEFIGTDAEKNILLHIIYEFYRLEKAKQAIQSNDYNKLATLLNQSNDSIKNLLNFTNQVHDQLTIFSQASGSIGTKV